MCGIVGYTGYRDAYPIVIKGLKRLEYRGYDSAGVALHDKSLRVYKKMGKVADLEETTVGKDCSGKTGIGHTRWQHMENQVIAMLIPIFPPVEN